MSIQEGLDYNLISWEARQTLFSIIFPTHWCLRASNDVPVVLHKVSYTLESLITTIFQGDSFIGTTSFV